MAAFVVGAVPSYTTSVDANNFSGTQRILESTIRIPAELSDSQRTADLAAVNRKVAGSSPASGATVLNTNQANPERALTVVESVDNNGDKPDWPNVDGRFKRHWRAVPDQATALIS